MVKVKLEHQNWEFGSRKMLMVKVMVEKQFTHWLNGLKKISTSTCSIYPVDSRNTASRKIPESLGGQIIEQSQVKTPSGKILDYLVYRIPYNY